jgi:hypothetical protein
VGPGDVPAQPTRFGYFEYLRDFEYFEFIKDLKYFSYFEYIRDFEYLGDLH